MEETIIDVTIKGTRPLLQNKFQDDSDKDRTSKKGKIYDDKSEAEKRLEKNEKNIICQPAAHLEASMVKAAVGFKFSGRKSYKELFQSSVFVEPILIPHKTPKYKIDKRAVTVNRSKIWRVRPRFDNWTLSFQIIVRHDRIFSHLVNDVLQAAGKFYGIGDYRPKFGLFKVAKFKVRKK